MKLEDFLAQLHVLADELGMKLWSAIQQQRGRSLARAIADAKERIRAELGGLEIDPAGPSPVAAPSPDPAAETASRGRRALVVDRATAGRATRRCSLCVKAGRPGLGHNARTCRESHDDAQIEDGCDSEDDPGSSPPTEPEPSAPPSVEPTPDPIEPSMQSAADTTSQPHPRRRARTLRAQLGARGFSIPRKASAAKLARLDAVVAGIDGDLDDDTRLDAGIVRPRTRGDCAAGPRPCPFMGCRHHLAVDVTDAGSLRINFVLDQVRDTCALDVAERGEHTLDEVGALLNLTRERVRQIEAAGLAKSATGASRYGLADAGPFLPDRNQGAN